MIDDRAMRAAPLAALALLAACGRAESDAPDAGRTAAVAEDDDRIECRIGNSTQFQRFCTIERGEGSDGALLTLRKPDGGFRRLLVATDGRGVVAADGAEDAQVTILGDDRIEVAIGGDSFRLPATVRR